MDEPLVPSDLQSLYHLRLIVLLECGDNKFRQMIFTKDEFELISEFILSTSGRRDPRAPTLDNEMIGVKLRDGFEKDSDEFLGILDHYDLEG